MNFLDPSGSVKSNPEPSNITLSQLTEVRHSIDLEATQPIETVERTPAEALDQEAHTLAFLLSSKLDLELSKSVPTSQLTTTTENVLDNAEETPAQALTRRGRQLATTSMATLAGALLPATVTIPNSPTASITLSTITGRPHTLTKHRTRAHGPSHTPSNLWASERLRVLRDSRVSSRTLPYALVRRKKEPKSAIGKLRLALYGEEKELGLLRTRDRLSELTTKVWEIELALAASQRSENALRASSTIEQSRIIILEAKAKELDKLLADLNSTKHSLHEAKSQLVEQQRLEKEVVNGLRIKIDKANWARTTAEDNVKKAEKRADQAEDELKKLEEQIRTSKLADSKRKMEDIARADAEIKKKKQEDERAVEKRRTELLRVIEETRRETEDKARRDIDVAAQAHKKAIKRAREDALEEGKRLGLEEVTKKAKGTPAMDADSEKLEKARCAMRDSTRWPITLYPVWTPDLSLARFKYVCIEFDAIRFGTQQPLTVHSIPWPVATPPKDFDPRKLQWDDVKSFFRIIPKADYTRVLKECRIRYHPDKWQGRLLTIADEGLREQIRTAITNVSQSVGDLITKDKVIPPGRR